jgi:aquaporin Z
MPLDFRNALKPHWPEYLIEGALIGAFMVSALAFCVLLEHPGSPLPSALPEPLLRRALMGLAMGGTAIALIYSPWGQRSGAHFNPAVTLTFLRLGKIAPVDALGYAGAQVAGAVLGTALGGALLLMLPAHPAVNYAVTLPGAAGVGVAFAAEVAISFAQMSAVLSLSNSKRYARHTGIAAGCLVATWIALEAPLSGMSMNPARTLGSALAAGDYHALWIYFVAPPLGMLAASQAFVALCGVRAVHCAKLHHANPHRCIFRCRYGELVASTS